MSTRHLSTIVGIAASLLMAIAVSGASARSLSISNQSFRGTFTPLTFFGEGGIEANIGCPLTLEGSFHNGTIAKVERSLIGYLNRVSFGRREACTGGAVIVLTETLPWHVTYNGFTGTLPRLTGIRLLIRTFAFLIEIGLGVSCLYAENNTGREEAGTATIEAGGAITGFVFDNTARLPLVRGTFCPPEGGVEGSGTFTAQGSTNRITVRLI